MKAQEQNIVSWQSQDNPPWPRAISNFDDDFSLLAVPPANATYSPSKPLNAF
jgi:hypothetical protein